MASYEVVVVGAGINGLCAAHTFLSINPSLSLLLVESKESVGGVWSANQIYPGLRANSHQGFYEFSDFPLLDAGLGVEPRGVVTGEVVHAYLRKYVEHFDLERRLRLNTRVIRATERHDLADVPWVLQLAHASNAHGIDHISCKKLVIATGTSSAPKSIDFKGLERFTKPVIHSVDLGKIAPDQLIDSDIKNVTVIGGSKSAHDVVHMYSNAGKSVTWLINDPSKGRGAMPMATPYTALGPWKIWSEGLLMLRPLSWFCAPPWSDGDGFTWIRRFLHGTNLGTKIVQGLFARVTHDSARDSGLLDHKKTKVLLPDGNLMWYGSQIGSLNFDQDFYPLIQHSNVSISRANIDHLEASSVHLEDGRIIESDALVCAIGYDYSAIPSLEPVSRRVPWGCPVDPKEDNLHLPYDERADRELFATLPLLRRSPCKLERSPGRTPWRLWRFIAPPSQVPRETERNLAFLNAIMTYQVTIQAELTSLWTYAYLYNRLVVATPTEDEARYEACLWSRFGKWRAPYGMQGKVADFLLESMPFYDLLLRDLGLKSWRKGWGWLGEVFGRWYEIRDYKNIVSEWIDLQKKEFRAGQKDA